MGYAVVDVETTGFAAHGADRIIEVAVVHLDERGDITDEWCTLINPGRDLGPQHVHGIRTADVWSAPSFDQAAGALADRLAGRVLVAHNLAFDSRFLAAEFGRLGYDFPTSGLCTMLLAPRFLPNLSSKSLKACCAATGISQGVAHSALYDARATGLLLARFLRQADLYKESSVVPWKPRGHYLEQVRRGMQAAPQSFQVNSVSLTNGDLVVFTGQMLDSREDWEERARTAGLLVNQRYVTKATRALVAADVLSLSTKAQRARRYQIPIISEQHFAELLTGLTIFNRI
jgi:DNA polymerase-3 subunit epsilon